MLVNLFATPLATDAKLAELATPVNTIKSTLLSTPAVSVQFPGTQQVLVGNFPTPVTTVAVSNLPAIQNVNVANQATPTATPIVLVANPANVTVSLPPIQNVNIANVATPPTTQNVKVVDAATPLQASVTNWPTSTTVTGSVGINNFPSIQNVNLANIATPPAVQQVLVTATPYVYVINETAAAPSNVTVSNWPSIQNVNLANVATPPPVQNVNVVNPSTPTATPLVYVLNPVGTVAVSNLPATQNVNITQAATPLLVYRTNVPNTYNVNLINPATPAATPIVQFVWPGVQTISGTVAISTTGFNVNVANPATPPTTQNVLVTSTPIVSLTNTQVAVQNWPATQNVNVVQAATPLLTYTINRPATPVNMTQVVSPIGISNWPGTQNVNIVQAATPLLTYQTNIQPAVQNVNIANTATPTATPIVQFVWPATQVTKELSAGTTTVQRPVQALGYINTSLATPNTSRRGLKVYNETGGTMYLKEGATASSTSYTVQVPQGSFYESQQPCFTGQIDCVWTATPTPTAAMVTEVS